WAMARASAALTACAWVSVVVNASAQASTAVRTFCVRRVCMAVSCVYSGPDGETDADLRPIVPSSPVHRTCLFMQCVSCSLCLLEEDWGSDRQPCHDGGVRKGELRIFSCDVGDPVAYGHE